MTDIGIKAPLLILDDIITFNFIRMRRIAYLNNGFGIKLALK